MSKERRFTILFRFLGKFDVCVKTDEMCRKFFDAVFMDEKENIVDIAIKRSEGRWGTVSRALVLNLSM